MISNIWRNRVNSLGVITEEAYIVAKIKFCFTDTLKFGGKHL